MKVKQSIIDIIDTPQNRMAIAGELNVDSQAVAVQIRRNAPNGRMTKMDFLLAISKVTGSVIEDILESAQVKEPQS